MKALHIILERQRHRARARISAAIRRWDDGDEEALRRLSVEDKVALRDEIHTELRRRGEDPYR